MEINVLSQHENALKFRALRNQVLSSNIANADTPNYKARDIEFAGALKAAQQPRLTMTETSDLHRQAWGTNSADNGGSNMLYRTPQQPALDGNTVEMDVEQAEFAENALQYRASLAFLDGQIRGLRYALRGSD